MPAQSMLNGIAEDKGRHPRHLFEFVHRFAKILFFEMVQIKGIKLFKDGLQVTLQSTSSNQGFRQPRKNLSQLGNRGDPHFVPVVKLLLTLCYSLISQFSWSILQERRIQHVLQQWTSRLSWQGLVVFLEGSIEFADQGCAFTCTCRHLVLSDQRVLMG